MDLPNIDRAELTEWKSYFDALLSPASDEQIAISVERLRANYPEFEALEETVLEMVAEDMLNDLSGYPAAFLIEACKRWRNSPATRAPTAGQLKETVSKEFTSASYASRIVAHALRVLDGEMQ